MPIVSRWEKPGIYQPAQMLLSSLIPMENYLCPHQNQLSLILKDSPLEMITTTPPLYLYLSLSIVCAQSFNKSIGSPYLYQKFFLVLRIQDSLHCKRKKTINIINK